MESGRVAAQHGLYALEKGRFSASDLSAYGKALKRAFGVEYRAARFLRELLRSERVLERIVGRAQRDTNFASLIGNLFMRTQSTLGTLTPANLIRYAMWWRTPRRRRRR
jgi:flavin-dependent dehydrogenase